MNASPTLKQGNAEVAAPKALVELCESAWSLKTRLDLLTTEFNNAKARIQEALEGEGVVLLPGVCRVTCANRTTVAIANVDALVVAVGKKRFPDLVKEKTTYAPEPKLLEIASDAAHPDHEAVLACLSSATTTSVTLRADASH